MFTADRHHIDENIRMKGRRRKKTGPESIKLMTDGHAIYLRSGQLLKTKQRIFDASLSFPVPSRPARIHVSLSFVLDG
jgi:hypothetical protein